ncbi:hypothetical protein RJT34_27821 [Clitoria ternatea]|uniref:Uncharacterized protein n=1 Tax=Clitoria ternatea TaxID=43366 RepID=A0AAN9IB65_CLITE
MQISISTPLIVTGHGLGGSIASLFTISLLDSIWLGKNHPLCITYGSPLIGDKNLQEAISRSPIWNSCFLHVVSLEDPLPRLFVTNHGAASSPQTSAYAPFGTFLWCYDVNSTCFMNPDSIIELLMALGPIHDKNQGFESDEYGKIMENLKRRAIWKDSAARDVNITSHPNAFATSISLQLRALRLTRQHIQRRVRNNPVRKLNFIKIDMAHLEWYKRDARNRDIGYYDSYKNFETIIDKDVREFHFHLRDYWKDMVEEAKIMPQKGSVAFRKSWLYAGTNYRKMVEPLEIAEYYSKGGKDYVNKGRPKHFFLLEEWFRNETTKYEKTNSDDFYNWEGYIDEALLSRQQSMVVQDMEHYLNMLLLSGDENDKSTPTVSSSFWTCGGSVDNLLLSNKDLKVDENRTRDANNDQDHSYFEACVDETLLSRKGC